MNPGELVERAVLQMHQRIAEPLSLDELARTAGYSTFYFDRLFRSLTGLSPHIRVAAGARAARTSLVLHLDPDKVGGVVPHIFEVGDVFETCKDLAAKGVEFVDGPSMEYYGGWTTFKDSEGNVTGIHSPVREPAKA